MGSMMHVTIAGFLGANPELKVTSGGVPTCTFSIAVDRPYQNQSGERITDWVNVRCWRTVAETAAQYLHKGSFVVLGGRFESYTKELVLDGGEIYHHKAWTLVVESLTFGPKNGMGPHLIRAEDRRGEPRHSLHDDDEPEPPPTSTKKPAVTKKPAAFGGRVRTSE